MVLPIQNIENIYISEDVVFTLYSRVSTDKEEQKISKQYQDETLEKSVKDYPKWKDSGLRYSDDGKSGTNITKRESFLNMMADAEKGKFNLIIVREISRFSRNARDFLNCIHELEENGVAVLFIDKGYLSTDENGKMALQIFVSMAEHESRTKSTYTRRGHKQRKEKGYVFGADDKYGYDMEKTPKGESNLLKRNDTEAQIVERIFKLYLGIDTEADLFDDTLDIYIPEQHNKWGQVGYGFRDIVKLFNSEGIPSKKGNEWYTSTVANIIHNKVYCGYVRYNTSVKPKFDSERKKVRNKSEYIYEKSLYIDVIIPERIFELAQKKSQASCLSIINSPIYEADGTIKRDKKGNPIYNRGKNIAHNVYTRKLQCSCNHTMKFHSIRRPDKNGNRPKGYTCYEYDRGGNCSNKPFDKVKLDMIALRLFQDLLDVNNAEAIKLAYKWILEAYKEKINSTPKVNIKSIESKIKKEENAIERLQIQYEDGGIDLVKFNERTRVRKENLSVLQDELSSALELQNVKKNLDIEKELKGIESKLKGIKATFKNIYGYDEVEESIIDMFVERIVSHPDGSFDWYINIQEDCTKAIPVNKFAKDYSRRYELPESRYEFIEYSICFDEANDFVKSYGRRAFQYQKNDGTPIWKDIVARVYLVM